MKFLGKFALAALLGLFAFPVASHAQEVTFEKGELKQQVSPETLYYILQQADGDDITIHNVVKPINESEPVIQPKPTNEPELVIQPFAIYHTYSISSRVFSHRSPLQAQLYASVARGKKLQ